MTVEVEAGTIDFSGPIGENPALDVPVVADLVAGVATRETGFGVVVEEAPLQSLTTEQSAADLVEEAANNNLYYNIHTNDFNGGEIRGQLITQSDETVDGVRTLVLSADLDAAQEPGPLSDSTAVGTGTVTIVFDGTTATYSSDLNVVGLATSDLLPVAGVSSIHLHNAPAGENGPVITDIVQDAGGDVEGQTLDSNVFVDAISPAVGFEVFVDEAPLASLTTEQSPDDLVTEAINDNLYYNVHTTDFPNGEIRGQLILESDVEVDGVRTITLNAELNGAQEPEPNLSDSTATGFGEVIITVDGEDVTYSSDLSITGIAAEDLLPVAGVSSIHLHNAPAGENGPVITDIAQDAGGDINGDLPVPTVFGEVEGVGFTVVDTAGPLASLTTEQSPEELVTEAINDNLYYNIHTTDFPNGEIRGQLLLESDEVVDGVRTITLNADLDGAQEPAPNLSDSPATGQGTVVITVDGEDVSYTSTLSVDGIDPDNLLPVAGFSAIHLHNAPAGVNGALITDIIQDAGGDINGVIDNGATPDGNVFDEVIEEIDLAGVTTIIGSNDDDVLLGDANDNTLTGSDGDDVLAGRGGTDVIDGGEGIDTNSFEGIGLGVTATVAADGTGTAEYGEVSETFTGIENLTGSDNDDTLIATGAAANEISGGAGDDFIAGGGGTDVLDGGEGNDTNSFQGIGPDVIANLSDGTATYETPNGTVNETFTNFENLDGSDSNDILIGDSGANVLTGNGGDDVLAGGGGTDIIDGGAGIDTNSFEGIGLGVTATVNADGSGTAAYGMVNETFAGIENLTGSSNDDVLSATGFADNVLSGGLGDDVLSGGTGNDTLEGGEGNDTVDFSADPSVVSVDLDENGNATVSREVVGFSVSVTDALVDTPAQFGSEIEDGDEFINQAVLGNLYYNIHTANFPAGEIRGQLAVTSDETVDGIRTIELAGSLDAAQEPGPTSDSDATGAATVTIVQDAEGIVTYSSELDVAGISAEDLLTPIPGVVSAIHLHNAPAGENGPVVQDTLVDAGAELDTSPEATGSGVLTNDVLEPLIETDTLVGIENVVLGNGDIDVGLDFATTLDALDGANLLNVADNDQLSVNGVVFASNDIVVDGQNVTIGDSTFTVDADLGNSTFLAATNDGESTTVQLVEQLLGNGQDLIEGQSVAADAIDGIVFEEFVTGNGTDDAGTDFTITLEDSVAGNQNSVGVFVFNEETGAVSDVQIVAANAQDGGTATVSDVAEGEQLGFFLVQDGNDAISALGDAFVFNFDTTNGASIDGADGLEIFQSIDAGLNSDGQQHFLSGADANGSLRVGIEDLTGLGDSDFQDVVFNIERTDNFDELAIV